jgi:hypothetical protein
MKATSGDLPLGDDWWYEIKWDGMRLIVTVAGDDVALTSANGKDATTSYPELHSLGAALGVSSATLDGEVVVFDRDGTFLNSWGEGLFARPHGITIGCHRSGLRVVRACLRFKVPFKVQRGAL